MKAECRNCRFYESKERRTLVEPHGECRRGAPRLKLGRYEENDYAAWPPVLAKDWCGEYELDPQLNLALEQKEDANGN